MKRLEDVAVGRENNIDFMRFVLATLVILSHSYPLLLLTDNHDEPFFMATGGQRTGGELAVEGFFILSGFLITRSWQFSKGTGDYLLRRVLRIYPGFLAAILFSGLIVAPILSGDAAGFWRAFSVRDFVTGGLNLNLRLPKLPTSANGSLWSIRYEFVCYLVVAAFGLLGILKHRWMVLAAWLFCEAVYAGQLHLGWVMPGSRLSWLYCYPDFWPRVMSAFLAGSVFLLYRDKIPLSRGLYLAAAVVLAVTGILTPQLRLFPLLVPALGGYLLFAAAYAPTTGLSHFARRGDFSYGLYLYAYPIQQLLVHWMAPQLHPLTLFLLAWAVTGVFAYLSWHWVESPFMRLKRSSRPKGTRPEETSEASSPEPVVDSTIVAPEAS